MMLKISILAILLPIVFGVSCANNENETAVDDIVQLEDTVSLLNQAETSDEPFDIALQIDKIDDDVYVLAITMEIDSGSWVVSPLAYNYPYGKMDISITDKGHLVKEDSLLEIPESKEVFDPVFEESYKLIEEKTIFTQKLKVLTQDDFEVSGLIWFVLEPICDPYEVAFIISYKSGEMEIDKSNTTLFYVR